MSADTNKQLVQKWYEEISSQGRLDLVGEVFASDYVNHEPGMNWPRGTEAPKMVVNMYRTAFPNLKFTVVEQLADGDKVVTRWTATATHQGPLMNLPPSGKSAKITGTSIERIANGKIAETWINFDLLGLISQLGFMPAN